MKAKYAILLLTLVCPYCYILGGNQVGKKDAVRAALYYSTNRTTASHDGTKSYSPLCRVTSETDTTNVEPISFSGKSFMWLVPTCEGWFLISSTQKATPILAHFRQAEKPFFENFALGAKELLIAYEHYIATTEKDSSTPQNQEWKCILSGQNDISTLTSRSTSIPPLLQKNGQEVSWAQTGGDGCDKCYNKFCPSVTGTDADKQCYKAAAGCVAVAMAQIMWYWEWPYAAYIPTTSGGKVFDIQFYDWKQMPSKINLFTTNDEADQIARLLHDCGYRANMNYGIGSGTSPEWAEEAFQNMGYRNAQLKDKTYTSGWGDLIISELKAGRPVYYRGRTALVGGDGHAFVVNGYNATNGTFYINFGWNGGSNGYYHIDNIPTSNGTFNYHQEMIIGLQPTPNCSDKYYDQSNWSGSPKFFTIHNGNITLSEVEMSNIEKGIIYSGSQVTLKGGTKISSGSNVHIAIKQDIPCGSTQNTAEVLENGTSTNNDETASVQRKTKKYIPVHDIVIDHIAVYNISGQLLHIIYGADTHLSSLPSGFYVLQKHMADGSVVSETIAHIKP